MIDKNGRPVTLDSEGVSGDDQLMDAISEDERKIVYDWINTQLIPRKTPMKTHSSYGMKHILEYQTGIHLSNNQFKDAMLKCGYKPNDPNAGNWTFCISKKSPAFQVYHLII